MTDACADIHDSLAAVLGRERDDAIEILTARVSRTLHVRRRGAAKLFLDRLDAAQPLKASFANSTAIARPY